MSITAGVWFRVMCICVCVRTAHRVSDRLSFHEAVGMNEPVDPRSSRGHAPPLRTHARTSLCLLALLTEVVVFSPSSRFDAVFFLFFFFFVSYRKVVYFKLPF